MEVLQKSLISQLQEKKYQFFEKKTCEIHYSVEEKKSRNLSISHEIRSFSPFKIFINHLVSCDET